MSYTNLVTSYIGFMFYDMPPAKITTLHWSPITFMNIVKKHK